MPPAARLTDMHTCPMVNPGPVPHVGGPISGPCAPTVLIGGMLAARVTDMCVCTGPPDVIVKGSPTVLIGGLPAARIGDSTAHGGVIVVGYPTVMIGDAGGGGGGGGGVGPSLSAAKASGAAFTEPVPEGPPTGAVPPAGAAGKSAATGGVAGLQEVGPAASGAGMGAEAGRPEFMGEVLRGTKSALDEFGDKVGKAENVLRGAWMLRAASAARSHGSSVLEAVAKAGTGDWHASSGMLGKTGSVLGKLGAAAQVAAGLAEVGLSAHQAWETHRGGEDAVGRTVYDTGKSALKVGAGMAGGYGGAVAGAKVGAIAGACVGGPVGALVGAAVGGIIGRMAGHWAGEKAGESAGGWLDKHVGVKAGGKALTNAGKAVAGAAGKAWNGMKKAGGAIAKGIGRLFGG